MFCRLELNNIELISDQIGRRHGGRGVEVRSERRADLLHGVPHGEHGMAPEAAVGSSRRGGRGDITITNHKILQNLSS